MTAEGGDSAFGGSIPELYERYLVPLIFEPYAVDLASRAVSYSPANLLEIAAGTGVVTRALANDLPLGTSIVATDLNQPMLDHAAAIGTARPVQWRAADAQQLPFPDESFDVVVCQFGVMFFPDKVKAYSEVSRVLRPEGRFIFNVWDRIDQNEFADTVTQALTRAFPEQPPRFMARVPHGYHERTDIAEDLAAGGFTVNPYFSTVSARSRASSPSIPALAYCQGTPLRNELESLGAGMLADATATAAAALESRFGPGEISGKIQAHVVMVQKWG